MARGTALPPDLVSPPRRWHQHRRPRAHPSESLRTICANPFVRDVATQHGRSERQSRSRTFAAPAPTAASRWRRAAASRRTARQSFAVCPRNRTTFCRRASTWPCARSWGAIQGGGEKNWTFAASLSSCLFSPLLLFTAFKKTFLDRNLGSYPKDSNPQPLAPLGSALAPRAPRVLPPLSAPLPLTPAPPGSLCSGSVAGSGGVEVRRLDVALHRVAASLPRTSRKKRAFPLMSGGAASAGGCLVPAVHAPPPLSMRDLMR